MEELLKGTAAYKILLGDRLGGRLSHAYMLHFPDPFNLRRALRLFALEIFGAEEDSRDGRLILSEGLADMKVYPRTDKKLTVAEATEIVDDAAIRPIEKAIKLYVVSDFDSSSPLFQNKLLKVLEEPPSGVYFLLGASTLSPVLDTIISRVRLLEIPPFTSDEIYQALQRQVKDNRNRQVSQASGGILGRAQSMLDGEWYAAVHSAAEEICAASDLSKAVKAAVKYGDTKYKAELLAEMQRLYFGELKRYAADEEYVGALSRGALVAAADGINAALRELKFNANFPSLLLSLLTKVATENAKW